MLLDTKPSVMMMIQFISQTADGCAADGLPVDILKSLQRVSVLSACLWCSILLSNTPFDLFTNHCFGLGCKLYLIHVLFVSVMNCPY